MAKSDSKDDSPVVKPATETHDDYAPHAAAGYDSCPPNPDWDSHPEPESD